MWRAALSSRLRTIRWSSSGLPSTRSGRSLSTVELAVAHQRRRLGGGVAGDLGEVAAAVRVEPAGVGAGEQQQVGDEPAHPLRGAQGRVDDLAVLGLAGPAQRGLQQLEVGEDAGQRRAQLVRGVGDELALLLHRPLALGAGRVERAQHLAPGSGPARRPRRRPSAPACAGRGRGCRRSRARSRSARRSAASPGRRSRRRRGWPAGCRRGRRRR